MRPHRFIDTEHGLADVVAQLLDQPRYALDTEFHRERTYWPKVALVQIAWPGELVLIDPLEVDLEPLRPVMESDALAVLHAASQDLEVLEISTGTVPRRLFDTQIAAGFLGMSTPSLASLHERELGVQLPKGNRLTDWLERPLKDAQKDYAAADVDRLLDIHDALVAQLESLGRVTWAEEECEIMRSRDRGPRDPLEAWRKIKEARHLKGPALSIARSVAAWRERRAAEIDQPVRFVLSDIAVVSVSQSAPGSAEALAKVRGVDKGVARGVLGEKILAAVAEGKDANWRPPRPQKRRDDGRDLRPAVALVAAWLSLSLSPQDVYIGTPTKGFCAQERCPL
ncbi:MAG: HRDC domain-containing protein, partial [Actinomycetota bacterium]